MPAPDKPRRRSGCHREETEQVLSTCLTVAVTLGAPMDDLCIVGGLVPSLIIDRQIGPDPEDGQEHPGTNDLDVGLAIALMDEHRYAEISTRLRQELRQSGQHRTDARRAVRWQVRRRSASRRGRRARIRR